MRPKHSVVLGYGSTADTGDHNSAVWRRLVEDSAEAQAQRDMELASQGILEGVGEMGGPHEHKRQVLRAKETPLNVQEGVSHCRKTHTSGTSIGSNWSLSVGGLSTDKGVWDSLGVGGSASDAQALYNVVSTMAGTGVLQLPFAVSQSGWAGVALLILISLMCNYTAKILIECLYTNRGRLDSYAALGQECFGKAGAIVVLCVQCGTLFGVCTLFLILTGTNMNNLVPALSVHIWILIGAGVVWPLLLLKTLKEISWISLLGLLSTAAVSVAAVIVGSIHTYRNSPADTVLFGNLSNFMVAFSTFAFSFGGHAVFPSIEFSMRKPLHFSRVMNMAYIIVLLLYVPCAVMGYLAYGDSTKSPIMLSFSSELLRIILFAVITGHVICAYPILLNPISRMIEVPLKVDDKKGAFFLRFGIRSLLLGATIGVAILVPFFQDFMGLLGALFITCLAFLFPVIAKLRLQRHTLRWYSWIWCILIMLVGISGLGIGGFYAIQQLSTDFSHNHV